MKAKHLIFSSLLISAAFLAPEASSQQVVTHTKTETVYLDHHASNAVIERQGLKTERSTKAAMNIFSEFGGASNATFSINFDSRFGSRVNGLGGRAGLGFMTFGETPIISAPIQLNYLFGSRNHYFELGAGATFLVAPLEGASVFATLTTGYRYQPTRGGVIFMAGLTPSFMFIDGFSCIPIPYLGIGYSF